MTSRLETALGMVDSANAADPTMTDDQPAALLYGRRMSAELARLFPDASEVLQIAARGQHIERWTLPRRDYPEGRTGYLEWRREQGRRHGARISSIMEIAGYDQEECDRAAVMLRKERLKRNPEVQALEDVICFVFLKWYFAPFSGTQTPEALEKIVLRTARKMSPQGRERVLEEFDLPAPFDSAFKD